MKEIEGNEDYDVEPLDNQNELEALNKEEIVLLEKIESNPRLISFI